VTLEIFGHRVVGPLGCNCYVVGDAVSKQAIVIDPGGDAEDIAKLVASKGLSVVAIVATHAHFDHIVAAGRLRELTGAPFHLHSEDKTLLGWMQESGRLFLGIELPPPPEVDSTIEEGDRLIAGDVALDVIHTPGHSPGSITLVSPDAIFSGDTLFAGSIGRTDLPGGDTQTLLGMVRSKLFTLDESLPVYPGHGPATNIGEEKLNNPFVGAASRWQP
jgi:glyoxylase-like metal-dependent hydrolase (beta-lactamase superfamily II)